MTEMGAGRVQAHDRSPYCTRMSGPIEFTYRGYRISCHRLNAWWCVVTDEVSGRPLPDIISAHAFESEEAISARARAAVDVHCLLKGERGQVSAA
jgi:hypothetical protein